MHSFAWWPTLAVLSIATFTDLRWRRIHNWLVFPFMAAGVAVCGWLHGWQGVGESCAGLALGGGILGLLFLMGGMGAGDVKLCAAIGAWIGPAQLMIALVGAGLAGGVMVLGWAASDGFLGELFSSTSEMALGGKKSGRSGPAENRIARRTMPYAPAIAIGTLLSFFAK
jgi:prepilin peptidase CpaA